MFIVGGEFYLLVHHLSLLICLGILEFGILIIKNQLTINVRAYFWSLDSVPLCVLVTKPHCLDYYGFFAIF